MRGQREPILGSGGIVLIDQHVIEDELGRKCGATWGDMARPNDKPGVLHWCTRPMVEVPDPDGGKPATGHVGQHRCKCGSYCSPDDAVVVCHFPAEGDSGEECGAECVGLSQEMHTVKGSISAGRRTQNYRIVRSKPCGHVVRRGF